jgi:8-oxo-dGTP pyrophosphatase MutT (NUDIX family)
MTLRSEDGQLYRDGATLATVVWIQYTGDKEPFQERYLLMQRDKDPGRGRWTGLGGKIEEQDLEDTTVSDASRDEHERLREGAYRNANREVAEEAGVDVSAIDHLGMVSYRDEEGSDRWEIHHFVAETDDLPDRYNHREGELAWHPPEKLEDLDMGLGHDALVDNIRRDEPFMAIITDISDDTGPMYEIHKTDQPYDILKE